VWLCIFPGIVLLLWSAQDVRSIPPDYKSAPVFFEQFPDATIGNADNATLLHEGKVHLYPLGTMDIVGFDWQRHKRGDLSFWVRMERSDYLLPMLASWDERDREFLEGWVTGWLDTHEPDLQMWEGRATPNIGCDDAMAVGKRVMVFTWYLRLLVKSDPGARKLIKRLEDQIGRDQEFLKDPEEFNSNSNHGMWEAMGLFESTRVRPDAEVTRIALERLELMMTHSVSDQGLHLEHSPSYHFYFAQWFRDFVAYLAPMDLDWPPLDELAASVRRMIRGSYYLIDHQGMMPQVGDTDNMPVDKDFITGEPMHPLVFDVSAGYAVFKDPVGAPHRRYLVFCIQNKIEPPEMRAHYHNDVTSVYYSDDGEVILGDAGRYSYDPTDRRVYVRSNSAHNRLVRSHQLSLKIYTPALADDVWEDRDGEAVVFGAHLESMGLRRQVTIPSDPQIMVDDRIDVTGTYVLLWHLGPTVGSIDVLEYTNEGAHVVAVWRLQTYGGKEYELHIEMTGEGEGATGDVDIVEGQKNPMLGWHSPAYRVINPVKTIRVDIDVRQETRVVTRLIKK